MQERTFQQRNKSMQVQELTDVVAVRTEKAEKGARSRGQVPEAVAAHVPEAQVNAFQDAGWEFKEASSDVPEGEVKAKVFVKSDGRLALGTDRLTVQLRGVDSVEEANNVLAPFGCQVIRQLTFAPGLFEVALTDESNGDAIDVANRLVESGLVEFADPNLMENIPAR